jgi:hypothetical protein
MYARLHAEPLEPPSCAVHVVAELAITEALAHELDRGPIRPFRDGVIENLLHRRRSDVDVPAHAGGVGLDPGHVVHLNHSKKAAGFPSNGGDATVDRKRLAGNEGAGVG